MKKATLMPCVIILLIAVFSSCFTAYAMTGDTFTHADNFDGTTSVALTMESYVPTQNITAASLNLNEAFKGLTDICIASDDKVYLLCSEISKIVVLNSDFTFNAEITVTDKSNEPITFDGAKGIYVDSENKIYICDTNNGRIIITDLNGGCLSEIGEPNSELIPEGFVYQPSSISKDSSGYTYILSMGCYYGALTYSPKGEFLGFYGANTVKTTALDTLSFIWDKLTGTDAKRESTAKKLPYSIVDFVIDYDDFPIFCTGTSDTSSNGTGQIRKTGPIGANILNRKASDGSSASSDTFNFLENKIIELNGEESPQNLVSVDVNSSGYIFALDKTIGVVYVYDQACNLITAFGGGIGEGASQGIFSIPEALAVSGDRVLVVDSKKMSVTVFSLTEYGKLLQDAQQLYLSGDYDSAKPYWERVLQSDRGNQLAYRGLAVAYYGTGEYSKALDYARKGLDYTTYDAVWHIILNKFFAQNFVWLLLVLFLIAGFVVYAVVKVKRSRKVIIKNQKVKTLLSVSFHPFASFADVKYKDMGSVKFAAIITFLFYVVSVLQATASGFLFNRTDLQSYNSLLTLAQTVGLVVLWTVCNWLVCTLFSGIGKLKEIFIVTAYSLIPMTVFIFLRVIMSHFMSMSGLAFLNGLQAVLVIYTFFLLSIGIMTVQEYNFFKFSGTGILTVFGMIMVVFVLFMVIILLQQSWNFVYSLIIEVAYR